MRGSRIARGGAAIALCVALAGCGSQGKSSFGTTTDYTSLIDSGLKLLDTGKPSAARQAFQQAAARRPNEPTAHYDLGVVFERERDRVEALQQYALALAADPKYVPALYNKAVLLGAREPLRAVFYYRRVISLRPRLAAAHLNLGLLLAAQPTTGTEGLHELSTAVRMQPSLRSRVPAALRARLRS